jgi:hypothetical protein
MTGMFPSSGVPASDAKNSIPDPATVNCDELWYSTSRCQPRFDPAAANAMLAELINLVNCAGIDYDCDKLDNLCNAVRYLIQIGDSWCTTLTGGPNAYIGALEPPLLAYPADCCMAVKVIPNINNAGAVTIDMNLLGAKAVVRNDGQPLQKDDWTGGIPVMLVYCGGRWISIGFVRSQVPAGRLEAPLDLWVNNAIGNDANDGLSNTVGHALYTFQRAINIAFSYPAGPYPVRIHIMTGTYGLGITPPYAGPAIEVIGTGPNTIINGGTGHCFMVLGPNHADIHDLAITSGTSDVIGGIIACSSGASLVTNNIYCHSAGWGSHFQASQATITIGTTVFYGGGWSLYYSNFAGLVGITGQHSAAAAISAAASVMFCASGTAGIDSTVAPFAGAASVTGIRYQVLGNGAIDDQTAGMNWFPGSIAGSVDSGGVYY